MRWPGKVTDRAADDAPMLRPAGEEAEGSRDSERWLRRVPEDKAQ